MGCAGAEFLAKERSLRFGRDDGGREEWSGTRRWLADRVLAVRHVPHPAIHQMLMIGYLSHRPCDNLSERANLVADSAA